MLPPTTIHVKGGVKGFDQDAMLALAEAQQVLRTRLRMANAAVVSATRTAGSRIRAARPDGLATASLHLSVDNSGSAYCGTLLTLSLRWRSCQNACYTGDHRTSRDAGSIEKIVGNGFFSAQAPGWRIRSCEHSSVQMAVQLEMMTKLPRARSTDDGDRPGAGLRSPSPGATVSARLGGRSACPSRVSQNAVLLVIPDEIPQ